MKTNFNKKGIVVVSLFNGVGTLMQAMSNLDIKVKKYYSSEIKKEAIELQQHHFPNVIQVGDIANWKKWKIKWKKVDFIGSGSPCQDLSILGKNILGKKAGVVKGEKSNLFFTFVEILNHVKKLNPNVVFLQENVGSASKLDVGIMSRALGVYPVRLNSKLVTAQLRDRLYWTNIRIKSYGMLDIVTDIPKPKNKNILLKDIITSGRVKRKKSNALLRKTGKAMVYSNYKSKKAQKYFKKREKKSFITLVYQKKYVRLFNKIEICRLQGFEDDFCDILTTVQATELLGDSWTLPVIEHILKFYKR